MIINKKDILVYTTIVLGTATLGYFSYRLLQPQISKIISKNNTPKIARNSPPSFQLNPDILFLTPEVMMFNGQITKSIDKWTMQVTQRAGNKYGDREIVYNVKLSPETKITRMSNQLPYSFNKNQESTFQTDLDHLDIHLQYNVLVGTNVDLRTFTGDEIEATYLNIIPEVNTIAGEIVDTKDGQIIVSDYIFANNSTTEKELSPRRYEFVIKPDTEIASFVDSSTPQQISAGDLKVGDSVIVYLDQPLIDIRFDAKIIRKVTKEVGKNPQLLGTNPSSDNPITPPPTVDSQQ